MSLSLYELPHSPYCIPIARALDAAGVKFDRVDVPNWDRRPVIKATQGKYYHVPILVHGDAVIFENSPDTQEVARYVDRTFCGGRLFPGELEGLQQVLISYLEDEVEGITFRLTDPDYLDSIEDIGDRMMVVRHKERKFGAGCVEQWRRDREILRAAAEKHFARFELMLESRRFLLGEVPVYTDFLLFGLIGNYTWKGYNALPDRMPLLREWNERMRTFRW